MYVCVCTDICTCTCNMYIVCVYMYVCLYICTCIVYLYVYMCIRAGKKVRIFTVMPTLMFAHVQSKRVVHNVGVFQKI